LGKKNKKKKEEKNMARPLLKSSALRTKVDCYFSPDERSHLQAKASQVGLGLSAFIREAALGKPIKALPAVNAERWGELARVAANLNQIARHLNEGRAHGVDASLISELLAQVQALRQELIGVAQ
jgi:hypothetical protein